MATTSVPCKEVRLLKVGFRRGQSQRQSLPCSFDRCVQLPRMRSVEALIIMLYLINSGLASRKKDSHIFFCCYDQGEDSFPSTERGQPLEVEVVAVQASVTLDLLTKVFVRLNITTVSCKSNKLRETLHLHLQCQANHQQLAIPLPLEVAATRVTTVTPELFAVQKHAAQDGRSRLRLSVQSDRPSASCGIAGNCNFTDGYETKSVSKDFRGYREMFHQ